MADPVSLQLALVALTVKGAEKGEEWFLFGLVACIVRWRDTTANVSTSSTHTQTKSIWVLTNTRATSRYSCSQAPPQKENRGKGEKWHCPQLQKQYTDVIPVTTKPQKAIQVSNMVSRPNFAGGIQSGLSSFLFHNQAFYGLTAPKQWHRDLVSVKSWFLAYSQSALKT